MKHVNKLVDDTIEALTIGLESEDIDLGPQEVFTWEQMLNLIDSVACNNETRGGLVVHDEEAASERQIGADCALTVQPANEELALLLGLERKVTKIISRKVTQTAQSSCQGQPSQDQEDWWPGKQEQQC